MHTCMRAHHISHKEVISTSLSQVTPPVLPPDVGKASTLRPPPSPGPTQNMSKTDTFPPPLTTLAHFSLFPGVCPWVQGPQFLPHPEARQVQGCWFWIYVTCPS